MKLEDIMDKVVLDAYTESSWRDTKVVEAIAFSTLNIYNSFYDLCKSGYVLPAMAMIRLVVDNCLLLYAYTSHPNPSVIYKDVIEGRDLNKNNLNGERMTATKLATLLDKEYSGILAVYKEANSYIHPSSFLFNKVIKEFEDGTIIDNGIVENTDEEWNLALSCVYDEDEAFIKKMTEDWGFVIDVACEMLDKLADKVVATVPNTSNSYRLWGVNFFNLKTVMRRKGMLNVKIYED